MKFPSVPSILWGVAFGLLAIYVANHVKFVSNVVA